MAVMEAMVTCCLTDRLRIHLDSCFTGVGDALLSPIVDRFCVYLGVWSTKQRILLIVLRVLAGFLWKVHWFDYLGLLAVLYYYLLAASWLKSRI